jgi:hypothetical protein
MTPKVFREQKMKKATTLDKDERELAILLTCIYEEDNIYIWEGIQWQRQ